MSPESLVAAPLAERLRALRADLAQARADNTLPAIERCLQLADMNLHWALWQLGEAEEIMPELEEARSPQSDMLR